MKNVKFEVWSFKILLLHGGIVFVIESVAVANPSENTELS